MRYLLVLSLFAYIFLLSTKDALADIHCNDHNGAVVVSLQGKLYFDADKDQPNHWLEAHLNDIICTGSRVKVDNNSRATLRLSNGILVKLAPNTIIVLKEVGANQANWLSLVQGFLHTLSRTPKRLTIETPISNAGPEGTEFALSVDESKAMLWVYEGGVKFYNSKGSIHLKPGQSAQTLAGQAPQVRIDVRPQDAVNWALYYPPILPVLDTNQTGDDTIQQAIQNYRQGRIDLALNRLEAVSPALQTPYLHKIRGAIRLIAGQEQAALSDMQVVLTNNPNDADALALQSIRELTQNRKESALALAEKAVKANPQSASAYSALSYAEQGRFHLDKAKIASDQAVKLAPNDAMVWARKAELALSEGATEESQQAAEKALALDANLERTQTVMGFAYLLRTDVNAALSAFNQAVQLDSNSPLARLGLGLAKIRNGDLAEGRQDLETAATLDPNNAIIRSYLGKAYYEERRSDMADEQFRLAKERDPKDPTPYFYDAIHKQTTNRPVEALQDMQKAIELNDNRGVYRSSLNLDKDLAARGAAIGRIYNELGFSQRGLVEGWQAINQDPTDYTSHRLLSDTYATLPRHDLARSSELLQSQLLQPINITPVQPRLAESQLFLLGGLGPSATSLNEFNPLFERNRFSLMTSGMAGSNNTFSDEVVHSGLWDKFSYSLGQFHYQTDGFRPNNKIDTDIYNAFTQMQITPDLNMQAEYRRREIELGYLDSEFDKPVGAIIASGNDSFRRKSENNLYRFGIHWSPSLRSDILGSYIHIDQIVKNSFSENVSTLINYHADIGEAQYIQNYDLIKSIIGGGYYHLDKTETTVNSSNAYVYNYINFPSSVNWTLGVSFNNLEDKQFSNAIRSVNPKFGLTWDITPKTLFRAAVFRSINTSRLPYQTIEPVQIAGFNQFFDDTNRMEALRWGLGLDHIFNKAFSGGVEFSKRYLDHHFLFEEIQQEVETQQQEASLRAYILWTPHQRWSASIEYFHENFDHFVDGFGAKDTETHTIPMSLSYFDPSGFFAKLKNTYYQQKVNIENTDQSDNAVFLDLSLGYRFPKKFGIFELQFRNLLDQNYRYQGYQDRRNAETLGVPEFMPFSPEFTIFSRLTLAI